MTNYYPGYSRYEIDEKGEKFREFCPNIIFKVDRMAYAYREKVFKNDKYNHVWGDVLKYKDGYILVIGAIYEKEK